MSATAQNTARGSIATKVQGLRINALAGLVMLLIEYGLGIGTLLIITSVSAVVRAALVRQPALIIIGRIALLAILTAWLAGTKFVADSANGASFAMAVATGVAVLAYATISFIATPTYGKYGGTVKTT
jgi:hypothetical protein